MISPFLLLGFLTSFNIAYALDGVLVRRNGNGLRSPLIGRGRFISRGTGLLLRSIEIGILFGLPFLTDNFFATLYAEHPHYLISFVILLGLITYLIPIRRQLRVRRFTRNERIGISMAGFVGFIPLLL